MHGLDEFVKSPRVAYFTMEVELHSDIHTYSGGLGALAGDAARSAADLEIPLVVVTLLSRQGYLRQEIDFTGQQFEHPDPWHPDGWATPLGAKIGMMVEDRTGWIKMMKNVISKNTRFNICIECEQIDRVKPIVHP